MPEDKKPEGSLLGAAVATAPFTVGTTIGVRRAMKDLPKPGHLTQQQVLQPIFRQPVRETGMGVAAHREWLSAANITPANEDIARIAWTKAIAASDVNAQNLLSSYTSIISSAGSGEVRSAIENAMVEHESALARGVYNRFRRNFKALSTHQWMFQNIPLAFEGVAAPAVQGTQRNVPPNVVRSRGMILPG